MKERKIVLKKILRKSFVLYFVFFLLIGSSFKEGLASKLFFKKALVFWFLCFLKDFSSISLSNAIIIWLFIKQKVSFFSSECEIAKKLSRNNTFCGKYFFLYLVAYGVIKIFIKRKSFSKEISHLNGIIKIFY